MKRVGIIGAGRFGTALAESLAQKGTEVILMDRDETVIRRMLSVVTTAVQGDASDRNALAQAGFQECDTAVVATGSSLEGSVFATINLKDLGVQYVVAKADSEMHGKVLERLGADLVVYPEKERAQRLARSLLARSALDLFEISDGASVVEMKAPSQFVGKTLAEAGIRKSYGVIVLAIKRAPGPDGKSETLINPAADDVIQKDDTLAIFGPNLVLESISE